MADDTFDPAVNYLLLEPEGTAVRLPGGAPFWSQVMSGQASDPGIRQLLGSEHGRLLSMLPMTADWQNWEMHPAGDEVLFMLDGHATFVFELADGLQEIALAAGRVLVVPRGVWHTARVTAPGRLLGITAGSGTQHRAV
jgi:mannose-6-phosphate isomerase-like protein (cupin superfamily)